MLWPFEFDEEEEELKEVYDDEVNEERVLDMMVIQKRLRLGCCED